MSTSTGSKPLFDILEGFVQELRTAGLPVSLSENIDATDAIRHIPLEDRTAFKYALAATMVKNNAHWKTFETLFEVYFSLRGDEYSLDAENGKDPFDEMDPGDEDQEGDQDGEGRGGQGRGTRPCCGATTRSCGPSPARR
jgi:uncharacterized protein with von Willebrand factor type A (vWA) domain